MYPDNLFYTKDHEWVKFISENEVIVGITHYAQDSLGDVVFVDLPEPGSIFNAHQIFGTVESVKTVSDLFSPISIKVTEVNSTLNENPQWVNEDPYEKGWMMKGLNQQASHDLLTAAQYASLLKSEGK